MLVGAPLTTSSAQTRSSVGEAGLHACPAVEMFVVQPAPTSTRVIGRDGDSPTRVLFSAVPCSTWSFTLTTSQTGSFLSG